MEVNSAQNTIDDLNRRTLELSEHLNYQHHYEKLQEVELSLGDPKVWDDPEQAQKLGRERAFLDEIVSTFDHLHTKLEDSKTLLDMIVADDDVHAFTELQDELVILQEQLEKMEFERMFNGELDSNNAYVDIQAGSGGTEAQDWAEMLLRMYLRWADRQGFETKLVECSVGEVAGIKSATIYVTAHWAYGWLRTETGVHRLVRKSPFNSANRRHTSFASVFVSAEIDDSVEVAIDPSEVRIDTYRSSGAGGQHVNKTDSAVRLTHIPTGTVTQSQSSRSQHQNKDEAWRMLKAKLYELEMQKRRQEQQILEDNKSDIGWGSQIRSYVLDDSRIKDLRTQYETRNTQAVLDGELTPFIEATLKAGL